MNKQEFIAAVAEILEVDPAGLNGSEVLEDIGNWDSLSVITFVAMVDTDMKKLVDPQDLKNAKTLNDLITLAGL